jgi:Xaa-Pro aminopeptidase
MSRIDKFTDILYKNGINSYFVSDISNIYYLSGFTGSTAYIFIINDKAFFISDGRYETQVEDEVSKDFEIIIVSDYKQIFEDFANKCENLFVDAKTHLNTYELLSDKTKVTIDREGLINLMRRRKDESEIILLKESYKIAGDAFENMLERISYGTSENQWAAVLEYEMKFGGAVSTSFDTIIASGNRSALPHGIASEKIINEDEPVVVDFGCKKNYCSDITRVIYSGEDNLVLDVINIVKTALLKSIEKIKPNMRCSEIDKVARDYITKKGYGEYFNHGLGHSVGIDVHENPRFSPIDNTLLEEGMVLTVEPGIYLPGKFGIRLEETILVTENGCDILSSVLDNLVYKL